jgi:hypothetical protein
MNKIHKKICPTPAEKTGWKLKILLQAKAESLRDGNAPPRAERARPRIQSHYEWETICDRYEALFQKRPQKNLSFLFLRRRRRI